MAGTSRRSGSARSLALNPHRPRTCLLLNAKLLTEYLAPKESENLLAHA